METESLKREESMPVKLVVPSYCYSCQSEIPDPSQDTCLNCGWNFNSNQGGGTHIAAIVHKSAKRLKIKTNVDMAVTIDRTGSSEQFQKGIPATIQIIFDAVQAKASSLNIWIQSHGDEDYGEQPFLLTDAGTPKQAMKDITKIKYGGGGDPKETHLDAIEHLLDSIPWESDQNKSRGALIALMTADTKPAKSGISAKELGVKIRTQGILLYLICEPTYTFYELVNAAAGLMFQISNTPNPKELEQIGQQLAASIVACAGSGTLPQAALANIK